MLRTDIFIATTAVNKPNYSAQSARRPFKLTIVLKEHSNPNIFVPTVTAPYSAGNPIVMSSFTNAAMIIVHIGSMPLTNSIQRKKLYKKPNLLNSNSITFTANIYSKPTSSSIPHR